MYSRTRSNAKADIGMTANIFCRGLYHHIRAKLQNRIMKGGSPGVIYHNGNGAGCFGLAARRFHNGRQIL